MNTTIGKSLGLALLLAFGVIATMLALGMFSAKPATAAFPVSDVSSAAVTVSPTKAREIAEYTISVTGTQQLNVGGSITVTFNKETVPATIATSAITMKASSVTEPTGTGVDDELVNPAAVTVSGKAVTLTVPDMDPGTAAGSAGDNNIDALARILITFTQAAGIQNADAASAARTITVSTSAETTAVTSQAFTITSDVSFSPTSGPRATVVAVSGVGMNATCTTCTIRLSPQNTVSPTTGSSRGTGTIDANGVFAGTFTSGSATTGSNYVWVTDASGVYYVSGSTYSQSAGATPRATAVNPGSAVSVDLVDFNGSAGITDGSTTISGAAAANTTAGTFTIPSSGSTATSPDAPYKFTVPTSTLAGTHKVVITDTGGATDSFMIEVSLRTVQFTPATASPGQSITVSGTGLSGTIAEDALTAGGAVLNFDNDANSSEAITIDSTGAWSYATRMPLLGSLATAGGGLTVSATDGTNTATSSGFAYTTRAVTVDPTSAGPGSSVTVTVAGFTVDNGEVADLSATFEITSSGTTLAGTTIFPISSDGSGVGTITIPVTQAAGTLTITATDNALALNPAASAITQTRASQNQTAITTLTVPAGTVTVAETSASTGDSITISGANFPSNTTGTVLNIGGATAIPTAGFKTDALGAFSELIEVPAATTGGSLTPGSKIIEVTVGSITGSYTGFAINDPTISIDPTSAATEEYITITGDGFNALGTVTSLTIGGASALPSPAPRAERNGDITVEVMVPLLNPGTYTVVMTNAANFSASTTFTAVAATVVEEVEEVVTDTAEVFADIISEENLVRVWRFDNASKEWAFYDPLEDFADFNDLLNVDAGDPVWVKVTEEQEFQGETLSAGWNLHVIQ